MEAGFQRSSRARENAAAEPSTVSSAHNNLSTEVARFPQAPAIQTQQIIARIDAIELRMQAGLHNTNCRIANQHVLQPDTPLQALHNVITNQPTPQVNALL
jgi:hypothetical protein